MDDTRTKTGDERLDQLPEHEIDDDRTTGAGILGQGGTAIDRGTGTLSGTAQGGGGGDLVPDDSVEQLSAYDQGTTGSVPRGQGGGLPQAAFLTDDADHTKDDAEESR